ncbi:MAG TPA: isoprenylcysteine carboxylmethyltransferase family protein [Steroidobacteraceae bacterium]
MLIYRELMLGLWLAWVLYWVVAAFSAKTTQRRESPASRLSHVVPLLLGIALIVWPRAPWHWLRLRLLPDGPLQFGIALALVAGGLASTVWARVHLGRNWSGSVTLKEEHELVRSGPYAYVRHPIYTGLLVALLGSAVACGELRAVIGLSLVAGAFIRKLRIEERFMREIFPGQYQRYCAQVPPLIPFTKARRSAPR